MAKSRRLSFARSHMWTLAHLAVLAWWPGALAPLQSASESTALLLQRPASLLRVTGAGRRQFVHGLVTAHINALAAGGSTAGSDGEAGGGAVVDAAVVDASGRTFSTLTLIDAPSATGGQPEELLALGPKGQGPQLFDFFERYAFPADRATPADATGAYECYELIGPSAGAALTAALARVDCPPGLPRQGGAVRRSFAGADLVLVGWGSLGFGEAWSVLSPRGDGSMADALREAVAAVGGCDGTVGGEATSGPTTAWEVLRVLRGRPALGAEYGIPSLPSVSSTVPASPSPLELGLWSSVHLDKGCYLGQELLARVARAPKLKRELFGVSFETAPVQGTGSGMEAADCGNGGVLGGLGGGGVELYAMDDAPDGSAPSAKPVGMLTSLLHFPCGRAFGLALLRPPIAVGAAVRLAPEAGGGSVGVVRPLACATRAGAQAGGGRGEPAGEGADDAKNSQAAKKAAEAERKAAKLAAMAAKMKELGLA